MNDLWNAIFNNDLASVNSLLQAGADVNTHNEFGTTILMAAASRNYTQIVRRLLEAGADVNFQGEFGTTALMMAVRNNRIQIARILINAGANVNATNNTGMTALLIAVRNRNVKSILTLLPHVNAKITPEPPRFSGHSRQTGGCMFQ